MAVDIIARNYPLYVAQLGGDDKERFEIGCRGAIHEHQLEEHKHQLEEHDEILKYLRTQVAMLDSLTNDICNQTYNNSIQIEQMKEKKEKHRIYSSEKIDFNDISDLLELIQL